MRHVSLHIHISYIHKSHLHAMLLVNVTFGLTCLEELVHTKQPLAPASCFPQMEYDEQAARKLLEELDEDKSGLINFDEFCIFLGRVK